MSLNIKYKETNKRGRLFFKEFLTIETETPRLYIRSYHTCDYEDCLAIYSNPELTHFFDHGEPRAKAEVDEYIASRGLYFFEKGLPFGLFSVFLKDYKTFIGQVDLVPTEDPGEVEIGWIFRKEFQNFGYCSEAVIDFLIPFAKILAKKNIESNGKKISSIIATAHPKNLASQRIISKSGLSFYREGLRYGGKPRNWYKKTLE